MSSVPAGFDVKRLKDRNYKGDDFNIRTDLMKDPFNNRRCTDIFCCLIFVVFLGGMGALTYYGYAHGDPNKLVSPIDGDGKICGWSEGYEDYPYLFIADITEAAGPTTNIFEYGVCVKECPKTRDDPVECKPTKEVKSCSLDDDDRYGATYALEYCVPIYDTMSENVQKMWTTLSKKMSESKSGKTLIDIYDARWMILASVSLAIFITFAYIKFMDWCAYWLAWFSVVLLEAFFIGGGFGAWYLRKSLKEDDDKTNDDYNEHLKWTAIVFWIVAVAYFIIIVCNWKSLKVSIAIIETAADFFADTKRVVLVPLFYFFVALIVFGVWLGAIICVNSIGEIKVEDVGTQSKEVEHSKQTMYMLAYMWFGIFWLIAFLVSCNEFVIIVATCTWYFSDKTEEDDDGIRGDAEVMKGFIWSIKYHPGSIAFGSFLLAVVWTIRAIFEYVGNAVENASGGNAATRCLLKVIRCCLDCFDRFVRFINQNAFIYLAISNENFCSSALNAFILVLKNTAKFAFVNSIGGVFMFIAKICISIMTTVAGWFLLNYAENVDSKYLPALVIFAFAYIISSIFISIFDASSNTILQCYLIDLDISRQNRLEPEHVPPTLARFLHGAVDYSQLPSDDPDHQANRIQ